MLCFLKVKQQQQQIHMDKNLEITMKGKRVRLANGIRWRNAVQERNRCAADKALESGDLGSNTSLATSQLGTPGGLLNMQGLNILTC